MFVIIQLKMILKNFVFASSATVYGEPDIFPTPESLYI